MNRRKFIKFTTYLTALGFVSTKVFAVNKINESIKAMDNLKIQKINESDSYWKNKLTDMQYKVLRKEATEKPFSSDLNNEKRLGLFVCAGCDLPLFKSEFKYESGTGWPSFYDYIKENIETKRDFKLIFPRTEYHCAKCGGHQGHMFNDGPQPTGLRYCNNGVALKFIPNEKA